MGIPVAKDVEDLNRALSKNMDMFNFYLPYFEDLKKAREIEKKIGSNSG